MSEQLREALIGAANYIDTLGGDSKTYRAALSTHHAAPGAPQQLYSTPGYALAMRVMQSDLYAQLDDRERAECDDLIAAGHGARQKGVSGAHVSNAPIGFTAHEKSAWSFGYEEGFRAAATAPAGGVTGGLQAVIREAMEWGRQYLTPAPLEVIEEAVQHYTGKAAALTTAARAAEPEGD